MTELFEWEKSGKTFIGTPQQFIDKLIYSNYRYNRGLSPETTPESWEKIFGPKTAQMEQRYQQELAQEK